MQLPALHGNWVDLFIIVFVLIYMWDGWERGFASLMLELITFVVSFVTALKLYPVVAQLLMSNFSLARGIANVISFFSLGLVVEQLSAYALGFVHDRIPNRWQRHPVNKVLSLIPLSLNTLIVLAFVLTLILGLPVRSNIKSAISASKLGGPVVGKTQSIEKVLSGIFGEALSDTFNFITISPSSKAEVKLHFTQRNLSIDETAEREMLKLVNEERRHLGQAELREDAKLRDLARAYARDMFERGFFSHYNPEAESPFDRMTEAGIVFKTAGENLALAPGVGIAHQGLMESQGHRENIVSSEFGKVGIGVIDGGIYGKMFVQEFTN